jgi:putative ABC transport system substrate-binding protein
MNRAKIVSLAALHKLPAIYPSRSLTDAGGLMSYSADEVPLNRRIGSYYIAPTKFEFVINLQTARAARIDVPPTLLTIADEVIE